MNDKVGLIAGNGEYPLIFTEEAQKCGVEVVAICIRGETRPELAELADSSFWVYLGRFGGLIEKLKHAGVAQVVLAGQIKHMKIFRNFRFDLKALELFKSVRDKRADSLLLAAVEALEKENIHVLPSTTFLSHLLCKEGIMGKRKPHKRELKDITFGTPLAREIAGMDIGQTIVVKDKSVIAVEGMDGTDATIKRAGQIAGPGCVVIKVSKPSQDMRFDVPLIGRETIHSLIEAKSSTMVVDAEKCLFLNQEESLSLINKHKICLMGQSCNDNIS